MFFRSILLCRIGSNNPNKRWRLHLCPALLWPTSRVPAALDRDSSHLSLPANDYGVGLRPVHYLPLLKVQNIKEKQLILNSSRENCEKESAELAEKLLTGCALAILTWANCKSTKLGTSLNNLFTASKIAALVLIIFLGIKVNKLKLKEYQINSETLLGWRAWIASGGFSLGRYFH